MRAANAVQLALDLPHRSASDAEDFFISPSNAAAVALIDAWPDWPAAFCVLTGPEGSGKSHLASIWRLKAGAEALGPAALAERMSFAVNAPILVEDADRLAYDETALFHLLNAFGETRQSVLLTGRTVPSSWSCALPDLVSRVRAAPHVAIEPPGEDLVAALLVKQFADRQLEVDPSIVLFIARRIERSMAAVRTTVDAIDAAALSEGRRVTRPLASKILHMQMGNET